MNVEGKLSQDEQIYEITGDGKLKCSLVFHDVFPRSKKVEIGMDLAGLLKGQTPAKLFITGLLIGAGFVGLITFFTL